MDTGQLKVSEGQRTKTMTDMRKTLKVGLTGNTLKLIAIFTMLIDHIGAAVIETGILSSNDMARMMAILETERGMQWYLADIVLHGSSEGWPFPYFVSF